MTEDLPAKSADLQRRAIDVVHFQRKPFPSYFSIEKFFDDVRAHLPNSFHCRKVVSTFVSKGVLRRLFNTLEAMFRQGQVNHVTGDVHYLTFLLKKRTTLLTIHDLVLLNRPRGIRRSLLFFLWYWLPARCAQLITVDSEFTRKQLIESVNCDPKSVITIHAPISKEFSFTPKETMGPRPKLLQIGTTPNKNVERLAAALKGLPCELRIIGRLTAGQEKALIENQVNFTWVAGLSNAEVIKEYINCDIVVFVSTYEGFGLPIVEANAVGRPVVASNACSMPEVAGDAACLVDPESELSIRAGIERLMRDPEYRAGLVRNGLKNSTRFRAEKIASEFARLYEELSAGLL